MTLLHLLLESRTDLKLAEALINHPELKNCRNKKKALERLSELNNVYSDNFVKTNIDYERQLHSYLENNWNDTQFGDDWILDKKKYKLDLLAKHRKENRWLVIELKKDKTSDETIGQILRYMGFIKYEKNLDEDKVEGLIISESSSEQILHALEYTKNIKLIRYIYSNGGFEFKEIKNKNLELIKIDFKKFSPDEQNEMINKLRKEMK